MEKIEAYKHESGEVFLSLSDYEKYDKKYVIEKRKRDRTEAYKKKTFDDVDALQAEVKDLQVKEKAYQEGRKKYIGTHCLTLQNQIDELKLQEKKIKTALFICKEAMKNEVAEAQKTFDKKNTNPDTKLRSTMGKLHTAQMRKQYIIQQERRDNANTMLQTRGDRIPF